MNIDFKEHKKELIIVAIYLLILGVSYYVITDFNVKQDDAKYEESSKYYDYLMWKNNNWTKEGLEAEKDNVEKEIEIAEAKVPQDLTIQKVNESLLTISQETGNIFFFKDCKVSELKSTKASQYKSYKVSIDKVYGSYWQYRDFLNYIANYDKKIVVSEVDVTRDINDEIKGSMVLVFYGEKLQ